jgi:hypothetical protein
MVNAYVFVQKDRRGQPLAPLLRTIPGIMSADDTSGAYDAIATASAGSIRQLIDQVVAAVSRLPGVTRAIPAPLIRSGDGREHAPTDAEPALGGHAA